VLIADLNEHDDAIRQTRKERRQKGRDRPGDVHQADHCRSIVQKTVSELGGIDILVNNAAAVTV
jgi:NAD(P)-dependent dehydrogenase (short-subunit alcohol dehydrogenase family)